MLPVRIWRRQIDQSVRPNLYWQSRPPVQPHRHCWLSNVDALTDLLNRRAVVTESASSGKGVVAIAPGGDQKDMLSPVGDERAGRSQPSRTQER